MSKIAIAKKPKIEGDLPDLRKNNIRSMIGSLDYLNEREIRQLEQSVHQDVVEKAYRLGIPVDYLDQKFVRLYNSNMRHMRVNLNPQSYVGNTTLAEKLKSGKLNIKDVPNLSPIELHEERWKTYASTEEAEINVILKGGEGGIEHDTTLYKCGRCKGNNCAYRASQTRSADEGETHRVRCKDCGNRWNHFN